MTFMATDQNAPYPAWKDTGPRGKLMTVLGFLIVPCLLLAAILHSTGPTGTTGSPEHLLPVHRPAPVAESVRIDAGGPHEMATGWAISYGIFGVSQTPGEAEVWV